MGSAGSFWQIILAVTNLSALSLPPANHIHLLISVSLKTYVFLFNGRVFVIFFNLQVFHRPGLEHRKKNI